MLGVEDSLAKPEVIGSQNLLNWGRTAFEKQ